MAYKNFKVETDADGIALVTWDMPGRSMNVLDETSTSELDAIVKADHGRRRGEGRRHHLRARKRSARGADLSMLRRA